MRQLEYSLGVPALCKRERKEPTLVDFSKRNIHRVWITGALTLLTMIGAGMGLVSGIRGESILPAVIVYFSAWSVEFVYVLVLALRTPSPPRPRSRYRRRRQLA